jgi:hypothetical protein
MAIDKYWPGRPHALRHLSFGRRRNRPHSFVGRIEAGERRVDVIEFIEIARILGADPKRLLEQLLT